MLGIKGFRRLSRFKRAFNRLDAGLQEKVGDTFKDLRKNPIPPSRRVKKLQGYRNPDIWEARVTRIVRLTFTLKRGIATLRNVGPHEILKSP